MSHSTPPGQPQPAPIILEFKKDLKTMARLWKAGDLVDAWPADHVKKAYNVRSRDNPDIATLSVPADLLAEPKKT